MVLVSLGMLLVCSNMGISYCKVGYQYQDTIICIEHTNTIPYSLYSPKPNIHICLVLESRVTWYWYIWYICTIWCHGHWASTAEVWAVIAPISPTKPRCFRDTGHKPQVIWNIEKKHFLLGSGDNFQVLSSIAIIANIGKVANMCVSCGLSEVGRIGWREKGPMLACYMAGRTRAFICWCAERVTPEMLRIWGCTGMRERVHP